eukprot:8687520-Pyramimonas_sp.AAC.1
MAEEYAGLVPHVVVDPNPCARQQRDEDTSCRGRQVSGFPGEADRDSSGHTICPSRPCQEL